MKRLSAAGRHRAITFMVVVAAVILGNLISQRFIPNQQQELRAVEDRVFTKLNQLEKNIRYQLTTIEQAQKDRERVNISLEHHRKLMENINATQPMIETKP